MKNKLDKQYTDLLQDILGNGVEKGDRTGTGTISVFGRQIRHKMSDGFPLLTTKKMPFKSIVTELLWFLNGDTNIRFLVNNGCNIWNGDAYKNYLKKFEVEVDNAYNKMSSVYFNDLDLRALSQEEFINKIKTDGEFAEKWGELGPIYGSAWRNFEGVDQITELIDGLKTNPDSRRLRVSAWQPHKLKDMVLPPCHTDFQFYTRELSLEERIQFYYKRDCSNGKLMSDKILKEELKSERTVKMLDKLHIPTRAISLMWNQRSVNDKSAA